MSPLPPAGTRYTVLFAYLQGGRAGRGRDDKWEFPGSAHGKQLVFHFCVLLSFLEFLTNTKQDRRALCQKERGGRSWRCFPLFNPGACFDL